jgi:hypothetical protein
MSAGDTTGAPSRRRRADRPQTVPLSEFGKEAPPPPRQTFTPRQMLIWGTVALVTLVILGVLLVSVGRIAEQRWSRSGCLDARVQC